MVSKTLVLLALTSATLGAPQNLEDLLPTGSISDSIDAAASSVLAFFSGMPTLADNIYSILETAIPESDFSKTDFQCEPTAAPWYSDLPKDVQVALTSYGAAVQTWAAAHASELSAIGAETVVPACPAATGSANTSSTGTASVTGSGTIASVTGTSTGSAAAAGESGASVTRSGSAAAGSASSTQSLGAAPRATGAIAGSVAGIMGALGVMALL